MSAFLRRRSSGRTRARIARAVGRHLLLGSLCLGAVPAAAQQSEPAATTRAAEAEAERRAKAEALEPYEPARAESLLLYIEDARVLGRVFSPPAGWFVQVGGLTEGSGLAGGGGYRVDAGPAGVVDARGLVSWAGSFLADVTWRSSLDPGAPVVVTARTGVQRHANQQFFGLGPRTTQEMDGEFVLQDERVEGGVDAVVTAWLTASAGGGFSRASLRHVEFEDDRVGDDVAVDPGPWFRHEDAPELREQPDLSHVYVGAVVDTRNAYTGGGSRAAVRHTRYQDRSGTRHDFAATRIELQQFVPIWSGTRVFAFSLTADETRAADGARVPFYLQPTLGGVRTLRGYVRQRFRDARALLLQAEYRYEINPFVSGALFAELGQTAPTWQGLRARDFRHDYGVSLRVGYGRNVVLRTDLALGGESTRLLIGMAGVF